MNNWISVKDKLPEVDMPVLVYMSRGVSYYGNMSTAYLRTDGCWMGSLGKFITHWMPLPEPPKGEE